MKIIEKVIESDSRAHQITIYPLGDIHVGAPGFAEKAFQSIVAKIANDPNAYWFGGGDMLDAVILGDAKRFDVNTLPDWMLDGGANKAKANLADIIKAQQDWFIEHTESIKDRCLGLIEGNHEYAIFKHHNRDVMSDLCRELDTENLTDCAFIRLKFVRRSSRGDNIGTQVVTMFVAHGTGGGITPGAEPNKLFRLAADKDVDVVLTGHSHSFCILPPIPIMTIPSRGELPDSPIVREKFAANWGTYLLTYIDGPSTYSSRALYPVRPLYTVGVQITPHKASDNFAHPDIQLTQIKLS